MTVKIVDITEKNFKDIPRPANKRFNCQECFYWMEKRDGRTNLVKQKKNWLVRRGKKYGGSFGKLLLWGKRENPVGYVQFGPIAEFQTAQLLYRDRLPIPKGGWCITCVAIQTNYRRKGLATRLVRSALRDLKRRGVKTVDAYPLKKANSWNQVSVGPVGLYQKCRFEPVVELKTSKRGPASSGEEKRDLMRKKL